MSFPPWDNRAPYRSGNMIAWPCDTHDRKMLYYINEPAEQLLVPGGVNVLSFSLYCDLPWILV